MFLFVEFKLKGALIKNIIKVSIRELKLIKM